MALTKTNERQITQDWQREIPSLGIYRPRHLLRRVGPLLAGICLDRDSGGEVYKPKFHVHFLGKEAPAVSLTLWTQLRSERSGGPDYIEVKWHEQKYREAAARMVRQSPLPLEGDVQLGQVIVAYQARLRDTRGESPASLYRDMILLSAWGGDLQGASRLLTMCLQLSDAPREVSFRSLQGEKPRTEHVHRIDDPSFGHLGGRAAFEAECRKLIENPAMIQQTVESQISLLAVQNLPVASLL